MTELVAALLAQQDLPVDGPDLQVQIAGYPVARMLAAVLWRYSGPGDDPAPTVDEDERTG